MYHYIERTLMSIKFVENLDEEPKHALFEIGSQFKFAAVGGMVKAYEFIDGLTGEHISFGIPTAA